MTLTQAARELLEVLQTDPNDYQVGEYEAILNEAKRNVKRALNKEKNI